MVLKTIVIPFSMLVAVYWTFAIVYYIFADRWEKYRIHQSKKIDWAFYRRTMRYSAVLMRRVPYNSPHRFKNS